ncbi:MAG: cytochrome c oxidase subunit II [Legionellales bacterium]|nr:cytochrome c oxidase subunit II [Legionellales bacterium]|tara:strand:+ start:585 stop:1721 length:1137 start_codon:yes stop_codon:yes gene_type:complete
MVIMQLSLLILLVSPLLAWQFPAYNMTPGVTPVSHEIYELHMLVFYICLFILIGVSVMTIYCLVNYRHSQGAKASSIKGNLKVEIIWTVIPFLLLITIAVPSTLVLINIVDTSDPDMNIKVIGRQWNWKYEYLDEGIEFFSDLSTPLAQIKGLEPKGDHYLREVDHPVVVPINKKIRFLVTSDDVQHSFAVPDLGLKRDAIPGYINEAWVYIEKPGTYRGACQELCGMKHGYMPIVVEARSQEGYLQWLAEQKGEAYVSSDPNAPVINFVPPEPAVIKMDHDSIIARGKQVFEKHCALCHGLNGAGGACPTLVDITQKWSEDELISIVLYSIKGKAMPAFEDVLSDQEIADVVYYVSNSWNNSEGQLISAETVADARR